MHEIGLCEGLLGAVETAAAGRRVTGVRVRVGARHAVVKDAFEQAFGLAADGTVAEGAAVDLVVTPVTVTCREFGHRTESVDLLATCASCGADDVEVSGGGELVLESIEVDGEGRG
jgi:hydrogenase nickel incorporation protein HypA/HybF